LDAAQANYTTIEKELLVVVFALEKFISNLLGKPCHLPMEIEHRAYWAVKSCNFSLDQAGEERKL